MEPVLLPVPRSKGSRIARLVETSNDESPHAECYSYHPYGYTNGGYATRVYTQYGLSINIPRGVPVALFLTYRLKLRSSYSVKTKASRKRLCPWCPSPSACSGIQIRRFPQACKPGFCVGTDAKVRILCETRKYLWNYLQISAHPTNPVGIGCAKKISFALNFFQKTSSKR